MEGAARPEMAVTAAAAEVAMVVVKPAMTVVTLGAAVVVI